MPVFIDDIVATGGSEDVMRIEYEMRKTIFMATKTVKGDIDKVEEWLRAGKVKETNKQKSEALNNDSEHKWKRNRPCKIDRS